jgi:signal transduction histidine kinase
VSADGTPAKATPETRDGGIAPGSDDLDRARALLVATNAFLACEDLDAVSREISVAIHEMFGPDKIGVTISDHEGALRLSHALGFSADEETRIRSALEVGEGSIRRVIEGETLWSDDPRNEAFRARIEVYGGRAGFMLPIIGPDGLVGSCSGIYLEPRGFGAGFQSAAQSLVAIASTAIARADAVGELHRQRRRSDTLLELSSLLAATRDRDDVERIVCSLALRASGAPFALVGRRDEATGGFVIGATDGLRPEQVAGIGQALQTSDRPSLRQLLEGSLVTRHGEAAVGRGLGIGDAMGAPIVIGERTEGFIAIGAPRGETVRPADWQELLTAFAAVTATALARMAAVTALARQRDALASEVEERTRSLLTAIDELRLASDAKTDFLANVSHELRTPLTSILGFIEILATGMDGPVNDEQARDLETVRVSSRHLLELIDDLIDIASIESGRIQLQVGPVAVEEVVNDAVETIRPLADAKGVALKIAQAVEGADDQPILVAADRGRLREIVLNLLSNAVKFTPAAGGVVVSVATAPAAADAEADADASAGLSPARQRVVEIAVRDTGPGIEPADLERIFEKFVRIASAATPGTGLGLPISRELARLHGGDLTVESSPGLGSAFIIRIPRADP